MKSAHMIQAEDVVQDTFAGGALDELQDDRPLRAGLFRIDYNRALDLLAQPRDPRVGGAGDGAEGLAAIVQLEPPMAATVP